jgi:hypothetical protein
VSRLLAGGQVASAAIGPRLNTMLEPIYSGAEVRNKPKKNSRMDRVRHAIGKPRGAALLEAFSTAPGQETVHEKK